MANLDARLFLSGRERDRMLKMKEQLWSDIVLVSPLILTKLQLMLEQTIERNQPDLYYERQLSQTLKNHGMIDASINFGKKCEYYLEDPQRLYSVMQFLIQHRVQLLKFTPIINRIFHKDTVNGRELNLRVRGRLTILSLIKLMGEESPLYKLFKDLLIYEDVEVRSGVKNFRTTHSLFFTKDGELTQDAKDFLNFINELLEYIDSFEQLDVIPDYSALLNQAKELLAIEG